MKASQLQFRFENKLNQRIRARTYGPSESSWVIMLLDDIHMPESDQYNVKSPIELMRQLLDYGGWYDTKVNELKFKLYSNLTIIATCEANSKQNLSLRQTRHFNTLRINTYDKETNVKL
jgi:dynein heavy chain